MTTAQGPKTPGMGRLRSVRHWEVQCAIVGCYAGQLLPGGVGFPAAVAEVQALGWVWRKVPGWTCPACSAKEAP